MQTTVAEIQKNAVEVVRVSLTEFKGHQLVDLRVYFLDDSDEFRPSKKGVCLKPDLLGEVIQALERAQLELKKGDSNAGQE